jgi:hypothetical protein
MSAYLRADLTRIESMSRSLSGLSDEFSNLTHVSDVGGAAGNSTLESALSDFASNWSDKRNQLIGQMNELSELSGKAVQEYEKTDDTLAQSLAGASKSGASKSGADGKKATR